MKNMIKRIRMAVAGLMLAMLAGIACEAAQISWESNYVFGVIQGTNAVDSPIVLPGITDSRQRTSVVVLTPTNGVTVYMLGGSLPVASRSNLVRLAAGTVYQIPIPGGYNEPISFRFLEALHATNVTQLFIKEAGYR